MYSSFAYKGLFARFCSIFAIYIDDICQHMLGYKRKKAALTKVSVRLGCLDGTPSTSMYACGVTMAGLMNRKKKKPPMSEQMAPSFASGYLR
jgi:hypothetical protein